jgi:hypothetical protein
MIWARSKSNTAQSCNSLQSGRNRTTPKVAPSGLVQRAGPRTLAAKMPSTFHPSPHRNAYRCRNARQQRKLFASTSTAETQPQLHPALLRLSAVISQDFARRRFRASFPRKVFGKRDRCATDPRSDRA